MRRSRTFGALAVAGLVAIGMTGCEPAPPRLQLTVNSLSSGGDAAPGDGICGGVGGCTLLAAIEEGNAAPDGADITVPAGHYRDVNATITGDLAVKPAPSATVTITESYFTVAAGGRLVLTGINTSTSIEGRCCDPYAYPPVLLQLHVAGSAHVAGSILSRLQIDAGGGAGIVDSIVDDDSGVTNNGYLLALRSSLLGSSATVLTTGVGATSHLASSVLAQPHERIEGAQPEPGGGGTCVGTAPTAASYLFVERPCGPMTGTGDASGMASPTKTIRMADTGLDYLQVGEVHSLYWESPLIDAVPLGHPACPVGAVDVYARPRGVDGNGDGIGGCDIGAVELQPWATGPAARQGVSPGDHPPG